MDILLQVLLLILGFFLLIKGADFFVDGASKIADRFHIPQLVIGLTIVAFGTSAPEAAVGISAGLKGSAEIAMGNVLGSNIVNILLILGITAIIAPIAVQKSTLRYEIPFVILVSSILLFMGKLDGYLGRMDGIILWVFMLIFLIYLLNMARKGQSDSMKEDLSLVHKQENLFKLILITAAGMAAIIIGSDVTVDSATKIATTFHMSERFIGLTIIAFGTSLPEFITSVMAAKKGKADIAIGNIIGSNIFNILFVLGTTAIITPIAFESSFLFDSIIGIAASILLFFCVIRKKQATRMGGILMLGSYTVYFIYLLMTTM